MQRKSDAENLAQTSGLSYEVCWTLLNPDKEEHTVAIIKTHLRTSEQKLWLAHMDISIEDMLNGRTDGAYADKVESIFKEWNARLGRPMFGEEFTK